MIFGCDFLDRNYEISKNWRNFTKFRNLEKFNVKIPEHNFMMHAEPIPVAVFVGSLGYLDIKVMESIFKNASVDGKVGHQKVFNESGVLNEAGFQNDFGARIRKNADFLKTNKMKCKSLVICLNFEWYDYFNTTGNFKQSTDWNSSITKISEYTEKVVDTVRSEKFFREVENSRIYEPFFDFYGKKK